MSRYLTPSKVALLALASLYCESEIPSGSIIPVLSFIVSKILPNSQTDNDADAPNAADFHVSMQDFERMAASQPSSFPGRSILDLFLEKLWQIDSLDALHAFFDRIEGLLASSSLGDVEEASSRVQYRVQLSRTSLLGTFVRRARLEFTRLRFQDTIKLWTAFLKYKEPSMRAWKRKHSATERTSFDSNFSSLDMEPGSELYHVAYGRLTEDSDGEENLSTSDIEVLLEFQIKKLQKYRTRVPKEMKEQLKKMNGPSTMAPSLSHFVQFFDAWRAGDFSTAYDSLHRYFDYTMQTRDKTYYQYALLHMAVLQADFDCFSEAVAAITETIATARENQDMSCLNFSLSWLSHLSKAHPHEMRQVGYESIMGSEKDSLLFLKVKAKETKSWSLLSSTLLSEAKLMLSNGESIHKAFELLYQSSHLNIHYNILNLMGSQMLMRSSIFGRLGLGHLADVQKEVLLDCYRDSSSVEEVVHSVCRAAMSNAQIGRYDNALRLIDEVSPEVHRTLKFHQILTTFSGLIRLSRAIRRSDMVGASHMLANLKGGAVSDPEVSLKIFLLETEYLCRRGNFKVAASKLEDQIQQAKAGPVDIYTTITLLNLKADIFARCGQAHRGFSLAMRAANTAQRAKIYPAMWTAVGAISNILIEVEEFDAAKRLLDAVIPQSLEGGDFLQCARLYSLQADTHMGLAGKEEGNPRLMTSLIGKAETYVDQARDYYKRVEDVNGECEMLAKRSIIARLRGDEKLSNDWAANCVSTRAQAKKRNTATSN